MIEISIAEVTNQIVTSSYKIVRISYIAHQLMLLTVQCCSNRCWEKMFVLQSVSRGSDTGE